ncbi:dipeptidase [Aliiglaciecola sp. LCG003]|uniref:dipeptidase n=1 Tax=Aliiglaciecola sp. LCG003 TaxID=3053655 RepID=UPI002572AD5F|nr:dipeptidase [Aliiglaciecola sp. LCG003]WJG08742.1 dipeptidase [Aliiglaciecola sp. LCG003]
MKQLLWISVALALSGNVSAQTKTYTASDKAIKLAQSMILVDGHIDVPYRLQEKWVDVTKATADGDFDYPRAKAGGLNAPFMSIYIPASLDSSAQSTALAHQLIDYVEAIVGRAPEKFAIAKTVADVEAQFAKGLISLPMGMENGSPIQGSLDNLRQFYQRGIRYITLAHSMSNHISDSSYDLRRKWKGLSPFGKQLVPEMNKLGIMVDISHVSDAAFYQAIELSSAPVIASHSSLRSFTPGFERNMDDDMLKALAANGGVIMINFGSTFVDQQSRAWRTKLSAQRDIVKQQHGEDSAEFKDYEAKYRQAAPFPYANVDTVIEHIEHVVKLVGIDHVGLGSDYDGVGDSLPVGLKDVSSYPNLVQGLLDKGYSEADIDKILGKNLLRVWRQVEQVAAQSKSKV